MKCFPQSLRKLIIAYFSYQAFCRAHTFLFPLRNPPRLLRLCGDRGVTNLFFCGIGSQNKDLLVLIKEQQRFISNLVAGDGLQALQQFRFQR